MADRYWVGGTGDWDASSTTHWSATSGGSSGASVPTSADAVYFDSNSGGSFYVNIGSVSFGSLSVSGCSPSFGALSGVAQTPVAYGNVSLGSTASWSSLIYLAFEASATLNTNGVTVGRVTVNIATVTLTLGSNLTTNSGSSLVINRGTFDANGYDVDTGSVSGTASGVTRSIIMGAGTWTLRGTGSVWSFSGGTTTITPGTSEIVINNSSASAKIFAGLSKTYNNLTISDCGSGGVTISGSNTFNSFSANLPGKTVKFNNGATNTATNWSLSGSSGNLIVLTSNTTAVATLAKAGGGSVSVDYANISWITGSPSSTWYAANSTDSGNNSGITFSSAAQPGNLFFGSNF